VIPDGMLDPDVLALAAASGRVLVSRDAATMPRHFAEFLSEHRYSPGILLVPSSKSIGSVFSKE
jgi:hypothetical protein